MQTASGTSWRRGSAAGGRGRGPAGRGRKGRNNDQHTPHLPQNKRKTCPPPVVQVYSHPDASFQDFHDHCRFSKYRAHRPGCENKPIQAVIEGVRSGKTELRYVNTRKTELRYVNTEIEPEAKEETDATVIDSPEGNPLDGLIVLPQQGGGTRSMYFCRNTDLNSYNKDWQTTEQKLKKEVFASLSTPANEQQQSENPPAPPFELSCAVSLLEIEPNGFACISSPEVELINQARDMARQAASSKREANDGLHADHAHYVVSLPRQSLLRLYHSKTRSQTFQAQDEVKQHLADQGVPVFDSVTEEAPNSGIDLQHHVRTVLQSTKDQKYQDDWWLVIVYDDTKTGKDGTSETKKPCWALDLPGGKRGLGETALEAAIRETVEETSLQWDESWISEKLQTDSSNRFYVLSPPLSLHS